MITSNTGAILFLALAVVGQGFRRQSVDSGTIRASTKQNASTTVRFQDVTHFALSQSQIDGLCTEEVVREGCGFLGVHAAANVSVTTLAETLVADEPEIEAFLEILGLRFNRSCGCRAFCDAMVAHIPTVLNVAAPFKSDLGCTDGDCKEDAIDLSTDALLREGLESPPQDVTTYNLTLPDARNTEDILPVDPKIRGQMLLRTALNVIFGIFPAPDGYAYDGKQGSRAAPKGRKRSKRAASGAVDVEFGPKIKSSRHRSYLEYSLKAAAWISQALRKLKAGRFYVKKWFILSSEEAINAQIAETRRHLMRMLKLTSWFIIKKGKAPEEDGPCRVEEEDGVVMGTTAYVMVSGMCGVQSRRDCGEKLQNGRYVVNICEFYWRLGASIGSRVGTLIHESSHHFGTSDEGYCSQVDCLALSSTQARNNADTYLKLVQELVSDRRLQEESQAIPHMSCNTICGASLYEDWDFDDSLPDDKCGQCQDVIRVFGNCDDQEQMAIGALTKLCCSIRQCQTTTTTTTMPKVCPSYSIQQYPDRDGECVCKRGYGCSQYVSAKHHPCPSRRDRYNRQWFPADCDTCKCYQLQQPQLFGGWRW